MRRPRRHHRPIVVALYLNAALLLAVLVALMTRGGTGGGWPQFLPAAYAAPQPGQPIAGGGGVYVMPGQMSMNTWGVYVMDIDQQTLCAYQFQPGKKRLDLFAARNFTHDLKLKNFNTDPDPEEVRDLAERERLGARGAAAGPRKPARGGDDDGFDDAPVIDDDAAGAGEEQAVEGEESGPRRTVIKEVEVDEEPEEGR
jgi:hypothetical protein